MGFSSILPVAGNEEGREGDPADQYLTLSLVSPAEFCGFLIMFTVYMTPRLLMTNGGHLSQKEKDFSQALAGFIDREMNPATDLKLGLKGKGMKPDLLQIN